MGKRALRMIENTKSSKVTLEDALGDSLHKHSKLLDSDKKNMVDEVQFYFSSFYFRHVLCCYSYNSIDLGFEKVLEPHKAEIKCSQTKDTESRKEKCMGFSLRSNYHHSTI